MFEATKKELAGGNKTLAKEIKVDEDDQICISKYVNE